MLNLLSIMLMIGMTSIFPSKAPVSNSETTKFVKTETITDAPQATCDVEDIRFLIATEYSVSPESISISNDLTTFTVQHFKGVTVEGGLVIYNCGVDCTVLTVRSTLGVFTRKLLCNF